MNFRIVMFFFFFLKLRGMFLHFLSYYTMHFGLVLWHNYIFQVLLVIKIINLGLPPFRFLALGTKLPGELHVVHLSTTFLFTLTNSCI